MPIWIPHDTHPGYRFEVEPIELDEANQHGLTSVWKILRGWLGEAEIEDAAEVGRIIHEEHQLANLALGLATDLMPARFKKGVIDSDGDPVLDSDGHPLTVLKDKHPIRREFGAVDGKVELVLPEGLEAEETAVIRAGLAERFGDKATIRD